MTVLESLRKIFVEEYFLFLEFYFLVNSVIWVLHQGKKRAALSRSTTDNNFTIPNNINIVKISEGKW